MEDFYFSDRCEAAHHDAQHVIDPYRVSEQVERISKDGDRRTISLAQEYLFRNKGIRWPINQNSFRRTWQ